MNEKNDFKVEPKNNIEKIKKINPEKLIYWRRQLYLNRISKI